MLTTILKADNITKTLKNGEEILRGISLEIQKNTFTAMLGPSGSGKTTLLNILSGLIHPSSGTVCYKDMTVTDFSESRLAAWKRDKAGHVFQNYLLLNHLTVRENIEIGISPKSAPLPIARLAGMLEIEPIMDKFPAGLSGGQQQRVAIARAVIKKPDLLFCDEATGALDEANSKNVISLLHRMKSEFGVTILFVTHNLQIARTADRVLTIKDGRLSGDRTNENPIAACDMVWE